MEVKQRRGTPLVSGAAPSLLPDGEVPAAAGLADVQSGSPGLRAHGAACP